MFKCAIGVLVLFAVCGCESAVAESAFPGSDGLSWQNPAGEDSKGGSLELDWQTAASYCDKLEWAKFSDWRLPTLAEAATLVTNCKAFKTAFDAGQYPSVASPVCSGKGPGEGGLFTPAGLLGASSWMWTSDQAPLQVVGVKSYFMISYQHGGAVGSTPETSTLDVRCVRSGL